MRASQPRAGTEEEGMATNPNAKQESTVGTTLGWGALAVFSIA
jgi:hypothetical protein